MLPKKISLYEILKNPKIVKVSDSYYDHINKSRHSLGKVVP